MIMKSRWGNALNRCANLAAREAARVMRRWQRVITRAGSLEARFPGALDCWRIKSDVEFDDVLDEAERLLKHLKVSGGRLFLTVDKPFVSFNVWDPSRKGFFGWDSKGRKFTE